MLTRTQVKEIRQELADSSERLPFVFNALSDAGRYTIFRLLMQHKDLCVTDIANVLGISVPAASQQLKIMEMSGLVSKERMGQMICYSIRKEAPLVRSMMRLVSASD